MPGLFIPLYLYPKYSDLASSVPMYYHFPRSFDWSQPPAMRMEIAAAADRLFFVSLAMAVLGLAAVLKWETLFPDRRDFTVLGVLPLRHGMIFTAKLVSLLRFLAIFAIALNGVPTVLFTVFTLTGRKVDLSYLLLAVAGHAAAIFGASAFTFFSFVALEGVLINILSYRAFLRLSAYVQVFSIVVLLSVLILSPRMGDSLEALRKANSPTPLWLPPYWFVGLCETVRGTHDPALRAWGIRAIEALGLAVGVALAAYRLSYARHVRRTLEAADNLAVGLSRPRGWPNSWFDRWFLRHPVERASFYFVAQTVTRSNRQRLILAGYVGVGFALVFEGLVTTFARFGRMVPTTDALLSIPLI